MNLRSLPAQSEFAAALLDPALPCPSGLMVWNGSDPAARLAVYRNNVVSSLIDALAQTFPVVQQLIGVAFFRAMAAVFVRQAPPRSRILAGYGGDFPGFIEAFEPARPVPYLADVARLEMARLRAYHAADADAVAAAAIGLALARGDRIAELCLVCHPSVAIVSSVHAVVSLWAAHQGDGDPEAVDVDRAEAAMIVRDGLDVLVVPIALGAAEFVLALGRGCPLGEAAAAASITEPGFELSTTLALLIGHAVLTSIELPEGTS